MNSNLDAKTEQKTSKEKLSPAEAAVSLARDFRKMAKEIAPKDRAMQDDLAQEMALAALQCKKPATKKFFRTLGKWRARDFLRRFGDPAGGTLEDILRREDAASERNLQDEEDQTERVLEMLGAKNRRK